MTTQDLMNMASDLATATHQAYSKGMKQGLEIGRKEGFKQGFKAAYAEVMETLNQYEQNAKEA